MCPNQLVQSVRMDRDASPRTATLRLRSGSPRASSRGEPRTRLRASRYGGASPRPRDPATPRPRDPATPRPPHRPLTPAAPRPAAPPPPGPATPRPRDPATPRPRDRATPRPRDPATPRPRDPATRRQTTTVPFATNAGSIVTPSPGPFGTVSIPLTHWSDDESDDTGND